jgi:hypothetical protein
MACYAYRQATAESRVTDDVKAFIASMRRSIVGWETDIAKGGGDLSAFPEIRSWIEAGKRLIADLERNSAPRP